MAIQPSPAYVVSCDACAALSVPAFVRQVAEQNALDSGYKRMTTESGPSQGQSYTYCPSCAALLKAM